MAANKEASTWSSRYCHHLAPPSTAAEWCPVRAWCSIALHAPCAKPNCWLVACCPDLAVIKGNSSPHLPARPHCTKSTKRETLAPLLPVTAALFPTPLWYSPPKVSGSVFQLQGQLRGGFSATSLKLKQVKKFGDASFFRLLKYGMN